MNINEAYNQIDPYASHAQAFELGWNAALDNQWQTIEQYTEFERVFVIESGVVQWQSFCREDGVWFDCNRDRVCSKFKPTHWMSIPKINK